MSTYVVGDIQGCFRELEALLEKVSFSAGRDNLWCVGDLVNRGPASLQTLRFLKSLGDSCITVLGNHDLHLLAIAHGVRTPKRGDTLDAILTAPDKTDLLSWLQNQPLLYKQQHHNSNHYLVHAGIPHIWPLEKAKALAIEVEAKLASENAGDFFHAMYGNEPDCWRDNLQGTERLRVITNYLTRMRVIASDGSLDLAFKQGPEAAPSGFSPWFDYYNNDIKSDDTNIYFGHWAALPAQSYYERFHALDSGCVWGKSLTAIKLESGERISIPARL